MRVSRCYSKGVNGESDGAPVLAADLRKLGVHGRHERARHGLQRGGLRRGGLPATVEVASTPSSLGPRHPRGSQSSRGLLFIAERWA